MSTPRWGIRMADDRYLECRHCGARDRIQVNAWVEAVVGDGVPAVGTRVVDHEEWYCMGCDAREYERTELCFVGYPGITDEEKEQQREHY